MISVEEAIGHVFDLVARPDAEEISIRWAAGRVLLEPATAKRNQPPFPTSVMDGFAIPDRDAKPGDSYRVIGESAAGHRFKGSVEPGTAVRIFTGAPVPENAKRIIIQEDVIREGDRIVLSARLEPQTYIREVGRDFQLGDQLEAGTKLKPAHIALLASMGVPTITVARRPKAALMATGDELVAPGETPGPDQIVASNNLGIASILEEEGADVRLLPIAGDSKESLTSSFELAQGADLIVTIGGASVGDHDLVGQVATGLGLERAFYKIAMRPGKPLMAGRLRDAAMIGLPGNPVSSMVCAHIFLRPMIRAMQGLPKTMMRSRPVPLAHDLPENGPRAHYMRALETDESVRIFELQDSSLLSILAQANALVVRPPNDSSRRAGELVDCVRL